MGCHLPAAALGGCVRRRLGRLDSIQLRLQLPVRLCLRNTADRGVSPLGSGRRAAVAASM